MTNNGKVRKNLCLNLIDRYTNSLYSPEPLSLAEVGRLLARATSQPSLECGASPCDPGTLPWPGRNCTQVSIKVINDFYMMMRYSYVT